MNNEVVLEARPRPLSAGLWTLFSWLRRDERSPSSDSLSSVGSDRTVASFAFLTPAHYQSVVKPIALSPQGPPTDSYKKRIYERNVRRQYDRDLTLHRKYGLYKSEGSHSYDAFSLPAVRRVKCEPNSRWERDRRATSECLQRRSHVPGKRRAPPPPADIPGPSLSLKRRSRKRPAPQPPSKLLDKNKENLRIAQVSFPVGSMSSSSFGDKHNTDNNDASVGCKTEKYLKKETNVKIRPDKGFLKQFFENRKRNSVVDTASVKVLPSISELDKQAAQIIESSKLKLAEECRHRNELAKLKGTISKENYSWFCISCLRKYDSSVASCLYCLSVHANQLSSRKYGEVNDKNIVQKSQVDKCGEDKQKLKEMLKEMKDSLPKRPKHDKKIENLSDILLETSKNISYSTEAPTLKIGPQDMNKEKNLEQPSTSYFKLNTVQFNAITAKHRQGDSVTLVNSAALPNNDNLTLDEINTNTARTKVTAEDTQVNLSSKPIQTEIKLEVEPVCDQKHLNSPLKLSSFLNPVYIPKSVANNKWPTPKKLQLESNSDERIIPVSSQALPSRKDFLHNVVSTQSEIKPVDDKRSSGQITKSTKEEQTSHIPPKQNMVNTKVVDKKDEHSKRRDLINKLEQSIAKGDERTAAETAAKLAQLRLSCSVLSFSSQILSQPSTSAAAEGKLVLDQNELNKKNLNQKENNRRINKSTETTGNELRNKSSVLQSSTVISKPNATSFVYTSNNQPIKPGLETNKRNDIIKSQNIGKENFKETNADFVLISVLVEDREATRGPVELRVRRKALMRDLRREAEKSLGLASNLQRWIVGRTLCVDDTKPVASIAGQDFSAPFYLCVVEAETKVDCVTENKLNKSQIERTTNNGNVYKELMQLEQQALVPNAEQFECGVCMDDYPPGGGVVLRGCVHIFCKGCLMDVVRHCEEPDVPCPAMGCREILHEREIRALVTPEDYERWLTRGLAAAESKTRNAFHCRTRDCKGWALCEPGVQRFPCPVCKQSNCVPCQAIHDGETCEQHRTKLKDNATNNNNDSDEDTRTLLNALIKKGEALKCPECSAIITKKWGCDWVKCSACKTEICWVTRGRRWGPNGKGDTSSGCRCGVDGKKCHPSCGYCH